MKEKKNSTNNGRGSSVLVGYPDRADCARSYEEAQGPYNRYSSTSNVSTGHRYEGAEEKGAENEKRDGAGEGKHGMLAALFNSRTDKNPLARTTATN